MSAVGLEGLNKMLDGFENRTAEAVCTFAFCRGPGSEPILFQGRTQVRDYLIDDLRRVGLNEISGYNCTTQGPPQLWYAECFLLMI